MSSPIPPDPAPRTPTGGAWLGLGIAARGALSAAMGMATLAVVAAIPLFVDLVVRNADPAEMPPQAGTILDLILDAATLLRPYARIVGGSGVALGLALFVAAAVLVRGSEAARRATRVLLVAEAVHSVVAAVWIAVLSCTTLAEWNERYRVAITELIEAAPGARGRMPSVIEVPGWMNAVLYGGWGLFSATVVLALCWLAGRPFAREWCAARGGGSAVASPGGRR